MSRPAIADAPANQRIAIVDTSYVVPNALPRYSWARNASARPFASPPVSNADAGISNVVTNALVIRNTLMITAATVSSRLVPRIRPRGRSSVSVAPPRTWGITATPVSNPERPSASWGNTISATATIMIGSPCCSVSAAPQSGTTDGCVATCHRDTPMTTTLRSR